MNTDRLYKLLFTAGDPDEELEIGRRAMRLRLLEAVIRHVEADGALHYELVPPDEVALADEPAFYACLPPILAAEREMVLEGKAYLRFEEARADGCGRMRLARITVPAEAAGLVFGVVYRKRKERTRAETAQDGF